MKHGPDREARFPPVKRTAVFGDLILDSFVEGVVRRISPEAPVPVLLSQAERDLLGGAANVAANIDSLGGSSVLLGVAGEDVAGDRLLTCIGRFPWAEPPTIIRSGLWHTPHKTRYCVDGHHLLRVDREMEQEISDLSLEAQFRVALEAAASAVGLAVISDYRKGTFSEATCRWVMDTFKARNVPVMVDSKATDFGTFAGAALITPNLAELARAVQQPVASKDDAVRAVRSLMERHGIAAAIVTMAADGMLVVEDERSQHIPAVDLQFFDVTGAGDTVMAGLAVALGEGATLPEAAKFASAAAGVAVGRRGTTIVQRDEIDIPTGEIDSPASLSAGDVAGLRDLCERVDAWRCKGLRIGFTNGCFDIVHAGHLKLISEAAACCDKLIVAVNTDASVRRLKGPGRPVQPEVVRLKVISGLRGVAAAVAFAEDTPLTLIEAIKPDVLVKGADYNLDSIVGASETLARGGNVVRVPLFEGFSTTAIVEQLRRGEESN